MWLCAFLLCVCFWTAQAGLYYRRGYHDLLKVAKDMQQRADDWKLLAENLQRKINQEGRIIHRTDP
jgi:hypothetical protein